MIVKTATTESNCLKKHDDSFWMSLEVFPDFIRKGQTGRDHKAALRSRLRKCKTPNCCYLASLLGFDLQDMMNENIPSTLIDADVNFSLRFAAEFYFRKTRSIQEEYISTFGKRARNKHLAELREIGGNDSVALHPFTMLLLLLDKDPKCLMRVYCRNLWRKWKTDYEYESSNPITAAVVAKCKRNAESLARDLGDTTDGREFRFVHSDNLSKGFDIFLFQRERPPQIRPDFKEEKNIFHGVSWFLLGIQQASNRIILKNASKTQSELTITWFKGSCDTELTECTTVVFDNYDPRQLELRLLGQLPENSKTRIIRMAFRRSLLPEHGGLEFTPVHKDMPIHADLVDAKERGIIRVRSLSDISGMTVLWEGDEVSIETDVDRLGATTLRLNNAALSEEQAETLKVAFEQDIGIPLNKKIKPQLLDMGHKDVFSFLMQAKRCNEVVDYQQESFKKLLDLDVLDIEERTVRVCTHTGCVRCDHEVNDENADECPECQNPLEQKKIEMIVHNDRAIRKTTRTILEKALDQTFAISDEFKFEKRSFFPLGDPSQPDQTVSVLFVSLIQKSLIKLIRRYNQPVLIVHTRGQEEHAHLDSAGIAHLGFAYAVSAYLHAEENGYGSEIWNRFAKDCQTTRSRLVRQREDAVLRGALHSHDRLFAKDSEQDESYNENNQDFETDVSNLLRCVFPYTQKWGGANRPDGFCSLLYTETGNASDITKFNWSYDAKHSWAEGGYDFGIEEKRKVFDYVEKTCRQKELQSQGNRLNAHVIISNHLSDAKIADSVKYLQEDHRLGKRDPSVLLVLMTQDFLTTLYDEFSRHRNEIAKRWTYLSERMATVMQERNDDGFVRLDTDEAKAVVEWVIGQTAIETPADATMIREGM